MHILFGLLLLSFAPTVVAALRDARSVIGIFLLNLFFGWTVIGWFVALIWALRSEPRWVAYAYPYRMRRF